jgi:hypothetical protein
MVKTNSAAAIRGIRAFIVSNYSPENYDMEETEDLRTIAHNVISCFLQEKAKNDNRNMTDHDLFLEWMAGLPSIIYAEYILHASAIDILGDILQQTEKERYRYTEQQAEDLMSTLIWRELLKADPVWKLV